MLMLSQNTHKKVWISNPQTCYSHRNHIRVPMVDLSTLVHFPMSDIPMLFLTSLLCCCHIILWVNTQTPAATCKFQAWAHTHQHTLPSEISPRLFVRFSLSPWQKMNNSLLGAFSSSSHIPPFTYGHVNHIQQRLSLMMRQKASAQISNMIIQS